MKNKDASYSFSIKIQEHKFTLPVPEPIFDEVEVDFWDGIEGCRLYLGYEDMLELRETINKSIKQVEELILGRS